MPELTPITPSPAVPVVRKIDREQKRKPDRQERLPKEDELLERQDEPSDPHIDEIV